MAITRRKYLHSLGLGVLFNTGLPRGTGSSNPPPSSGESSANRDRGDQRSPSRLRPPAVRAAAASAISRREAIHLVADVAGYSRLIEADEEGTLGRLKALRIARKV